MKKRIGKGLLSYRGHAFRRSLLLILIVTTIPTLLIAFSSYYIGVSYIEREVERTHKLQLDYTVKQVSDALGHLQVGMNQWTLNPMSDKLRGIDFKDNYAFSKEFFESLTVLNNSSALIDQAFVYLESPPRIISDSQGIHKLEGEGAVPYHELLAVKERLFWRMLQEPAIDGLFVIHKLPVIGEPFGVIMARINEKQLLNLAGFDPGLGGTAFILNREGTLLSRELFSPAVKEMNEALVQEIGGKQEKSSSFRWSWNSELYVVSTAVIPITGWELVSAVPMSEFLKPIVLVSRLIMAVGLISLLFVLLSSWYASVRLVQPIHRLLRTLISPAGPEPLLVPKDEIQYIEEQWRNLSRESHLLQSRLEGQHSSLRTGFLLQLVQGHLQLLQDQEITQRMEQYGWEPDGQQFVVMVVQLLGFHRLLQGSFREDEQPLVTFAAVNIIEELTGNDNVSVMNLHDLSVGLFIMFPREVSPAEVAERLKRMASEIGQSLHRILKMDTVIGLGQTVSAISRIPLAWEEVQQALRYRKLDVPNQIIDLNEPMSEHADSRYPFTLEQDLVHSMISGLGEESHRLLGLFFQELKAHAKRELLLQQGSLKLLGAVQGALMQSDVMQAGSLFDWGQLYAELLALKDSDEMQAWYSARIVEPLMAELMHHQNDRARELVERTVGMIRSEYQTDISLDLCADRLGISSSGLSKLFLQVTGIYFVDYLTKTRLDRAKELLIGSELKMQEIAVQVGYQPTYFNRIFKKMAGMTPKDFREHNKL
ncbi:helix-turn-helix domain-containing protein [Paenibacillus sp. 5J-6]|uniref:Helix-turn-helix domain-containing protein n=1 Tax=Paenibacillus silvestris TaxID=2606219 RepID=A0A6L8V9V8_9BACL|nr:helix-turn-helix domain-containing protein [Paenibacillus silvestris]MZQ86472.1 helix-turn-helix domain-containing protein [Paenibacillus silvestris]